MDYGEIDMDFFKLNNREKTEISQKKKQKQEHKLVNSIRHQKGHTLYSINTKTGEVKQAEYVKEDTITLEQALTMNEGNVTRKVMIEKDCIYLEALNKENAMKRYKKR